MLKKELREVIKKYEKEENFKRDLEDILFEIRFSKALEMLEEYKNEYLEFDVKKYKQRLHIESHFSMDGEGCIGYFKIIYDDLMPSLKFKFYNTVNQDIVYFETAEEAAKYLIEYNKEGIKEEFGKIIY